MKQSLQLRVSQHLALTPQLQQSIRLLQLSTLELHQELEQILADNPMLERTDDPLDHATRLLADGALGASGIVNEGASMEANNQQPESEAVSDAGSSSDTAETGAETKYMERAIVNPNSFNRKSSMVQLRKMGS